MLDWLMWFTSMEHSKPLALVLFFSAFCGILLYLFSGRRAERLESYKNIPLLDDDSPRPAGEHSLTRKVMDNE